MIDSLNSMLVRMEHRLERARDLESVRSMVFIAHSAPVVTFVWRASTQFTTQEWDALFWSTNLGYESRTRWLALAHISRSDLGGVAPVLAPLCP